MSFQQCDNYMFLSAYHIHQISNTTRSHCRQRFE